MYTKIKISIKKSVAPKLSTGGFDLYSPSTLQGALQSYISNSVAKPSIPASVTTTKY